MTIQEALDRVDMLKPNKVSTEAKIGWLSKLDGIIWSEIIMTHELPEELYRRDGDDREEGFHGYDMSTDPGTELLVSEPYAEDLYLHWLACNVDLVNMEMGKYANDHALYNAAYQTYANAYNRKHMPISSDVCFHL